MQHPLHRDCYASCMAWVVTAATALKGTRPQPKLATHCTIPIQEAAGNGFPKEAPRVRLRRYSTCSHENLFLGEKIQKKLTAAETLKGWPWEIELARSILALGASELFFLGAGFLLAERASSVAIFFRWGERAS